MNKKINILLIMIILLIPQQLFAKYRTEFTTYISVDETYDDNIDLDSTNEKSDWITSISPGIEINIFSQKNSFTLNYSPSIVRYKERDNNNTVRQALSLSLNESISQHIEFNITDTYLKSEDPLEESVDIIGVRRTRNTYQRNTGDTNIRYIFGPSSSFIMGFGSSLLKNEDITIDDGIIIDPYAGYSYWFNTNHGLELNVGYRKANFTSDDNTPPEDDYSGFTEGIVYRYRIDPHSTVFMNYDFTSRNFKGSTTDYDVIDGSVGYEKNVSQDMSYSISAGYFMRFNDMAEDDSGFNADISLTKEINRGTFNLNGRSGWDEAYLESESRGFTKFQSVDSSFNYQVAENINNYVSVSYRQDKDETSRKSKTIRISYGWRWLFSRYFSAILEYSRATRDDDREGEDYSVNRGRFGIEWRQPFR